jgi:hypothetical protein
MVTDRASIKEKEMYRVQFDKGVEDGDVVRNAVTVDHDVVYPDQIVSNMKGGGSKILPIDGLSDEDYNIHVAWLEMRNRNLKGEYQTGEVTQRVQEKAQVKAEEAIILNKNMDF